MRTDAAPAATASSPETTLLLRCAAALDDRTLERGWQDSWQDLDWNQLFELAARHAVVPLASRQLARLPPGVVPPSTLAALQAIERDGALRGLLLTQQLLHVVAELERAGVSALPVKGPTLAALVYRDLSLRLYEDLDVLIAPRDREKAEVALTALGFRPVSTFDDARDALIAESHHKAFLHAETGTPLELHWSLTHTTLARGQLEERWWSDTQPVALGGATLATLGAESLVLYLCMHGAKHSWSRIGWLCDLHRTLVRFDGVHWNTVWRMARERGAVRMVTVGLLLVERLLDGSRWTDRALEGREADLSSRAIAAEIERRLRDSRTEIPEIDLVVQLRFRDRWRDRARFAVHIVAEPWPADVSALRLPLGLRGAYYVFRPLRLAWKHVVRRRHAAAPRILPRSTSSSA